MRRRTELAIVALPVLVCLGLLFGQQLLSRPPHVSTAVSVTAPHPSVTLPPPEKAAPAADLASPDSPIAPEPVLPVRPLDRGRELARLLYSQRLSQVWAAFSPAVRQEWGSYADFQAYRAGGLKTYGAETRVQSEMVRRSGGVSYYTRTAIFQRGDRQPWTLIIGLAPDGRVVAFNIVAAAILPGQDTTVQ